MKNTRLLSTLLACLLSIPVLAQVCTITADLAKVNGPLNTQFKECIGAGALLGLYLYTGGFHEQSGLLYPRFARPFQRQCESLPQEMYRIGYTLNDAFTAYLSMGKPDQLSKQQVTRIKQQNDGSPVSKETVEVSASGTIERAFSIRENDVMMLLLKRGGGKK